LSLKNSDYRYRAFIDRAEVERAIAEQVDAITYPTSRTRCSASAVARAIMLTSMCGPSCAIVKTPNRYEPPTARGVERCGLRVGTARTLIGLR
jgi:hypothetical protein